MLATRTAYWPASRASGEQQRLLPRPARRAEEAALRRRVMEEMRAAVGDGALRDQFRAAVNNNGATPFFTACHFCVPEVIEALLAWGYVDYDMLLQPTSSKAETAEHALLDCPAYADLRSTARFSPLFANPPAQARMRALAGAADQYALGAFVHACFERRTQSPP
ncbi:MAG: hypothetical protein J3K34DRAFT_91905 [Monoraphidium minutum]|nr:MAG: hypothetical protein J3K34DRAFT_91905 [Monoraphidium minutum]